MYSPTVMDHFANPRNIGELADPSAYARIRSDIHDDLIELYLHIEDERIVGIKFRVRGCVAAIASTSIASEMVKGMTLAQAESLSAEQIVEALAGLPENKVECSVLAPAALREAIATYRAATRSLSPAAEPPSRCPPPTRTNRQAAAARLPGAAPTARLSAPVKKKVARG